MNGARRARLLQLAAGATFLVVAALLVVIVLSASNGGSGGDTKLEGVGSVKPQLRGIPQAGLTLGDPGAPVELIEYGDLQCPVCRTYAEEILPQIIAGPVAQGRSKLSFRNFPILGSQSVPAATAALAAGAQGRGWNYIELFYRNQGRENSGYAEDERFLTALAKAVGVGDLARWNRQRRSAAFAAEVRRTGEQAQMLGFTGTPSFAIKRPRSSGLEPLGTLPSAAELEAAIEATG